MDPRQPQSNSRNRGRHHPILPSLWNTCHPERNRIQRLRPPLGKCGCRLAGFYRLRGCWVSFCILAECSNGRNGGGAVQWHWGAGSSRCYWRALGYGGVREGEVWRDGGEDGRGGVGGEGWMAGSGEEYRRFMAECQEHFY